METKEVIISAVIVAKPGKGTEMLNMFTPLVKASNAEPGCIKYDLHIATEKPDTFVMYEIWKDSDAFEQHIQSEHFNMYKQKSESILQSLEITKLKKVNP